MLLDWLAGLAAYNFDIIIRPGGNNADADGMSRLPGLDGSRHTQHISIDSVEAMCNVIHTQPYVETLCMNIDVMDQDADQPGQQLTSMTEADW